MASAEGVNAHSTPRPVTMDHFAATVANFVGQRSGVDPALITSDFDYIARGVARPARNDGPFRRRRVRARGDFDIRKANTVTKLYAHYVSAAVDDGLAAAS